MMNSPGLGGLGGLFQLLSSLGGGNSVGSPTTNPLMGPGGIKGGTPDQGNGDLSALWPFLQQIMAHPQGGQIFQQLLGLGQPQLPPQKMMPQIQNPLVTPPPIMPTPQDQSVRTATPGQRSTSTPQGQPKIGSNGQPIFPMQGQMDNPFMRLGGRGGLM